jgi:ABC-type multidrug transport system ATPase subunit
MTSALSADRLGRRYGRRWALEDCTVEIPAGAVVALVGPNGAGKTTLLHLAAGLVRPTTGAIHALGGDPGRDTALLARIGLVAQDAPLYRSFTVQDMLRAGRALNQAWDDEGAVHRLDALGIPMDQRIGSLSGGQRAQVALAVALAKRPALLLLDEPLASLDPLARRELLATLMLTAADGDITIVISSHLIADLERVCDHLILLAGGRVQVAGTMDALLADHRVLTGPRPAGPIAGVAAIIDEQRDSHGATMTVRTVGPVPDPRWVTEDVTLEELVLAYLTRAQRPAAPLASAPEPAEVTP